MEIKFKTGAVFDSKTVTRKVCVALRLGEPLSVTRRETVLVLGPCDSVGVQVNKPFDEFIVAPLGGVVAKLNVRIFAGISASEATALKLSKVPSTTVLFEIEFKTGA